MTLELGLITLLNDISSKWYSVRAATVKILRWARIVTCWFGGGWYLTSWIKGKSNFLRKGITCIVDIVITCSQSLWVSAQKHKWRSNLFPTISMFPINRKLQLLSNLPTMICRLWTNWEGHRFWRKKMSGKFKDYWNIIDKIISKLYKFWQKLCQDPSPPPLTPSSAPLYKKSKSYALSITQLPLSSWACFKK